MRRPGRTPGFHETHGTHRMKDVHISSDATTPGIEPRRRFRTAACAVGVVLVVLGIHAAGRIAAFCSPYVVDSRIYSLAAYSFWQPEPSADAIVPDKPPGQALLTGWVFRVWPNEPSRATLVPVESAFMLAAYAIFAALAIRLAGGVAAAVAVVGLVIAFNAYNASDSTTDGFNLGENYVAAPILLAVYAHLCIRHRGVGGVLTGVGLGLALAIKQTALAVTVAVLLHSVYVCVATRSLKSRAIRLEWMLVGVIAAWLPIAGALQWRGLLELQIRGLLDHSTSHVEWHGPSWPTGAMIGPLLPLLLWMVVGSVMRSTLHSGARASHGASPVVFAIIWFACELGMTSMMTKPAEHYAQLVVLPAALLAAFGVSAVQRALTPLSAVRRRRARACLIAATVCLCVTSAMPVINLARRFGPTFDLAVERAFFQKIQRHEDGSFR